MNRLHGWLCRSEFWREELQKVTLPWVLSKVELGQEVLEVGPGPGLTTDLLRPRIQKMTVIEIDPALANSLAARLQGSNVTVIRGDATAMPLEDNQFSAAVSFTMLHHVPSADLQDQLLREVWRVLRPGGVLVGVDSRQSLGMRLIHIHDTLVPIDPETFGKRLEAAGFEDIAIETRTRAFRFQGRRPAGAP
jgi:ubiquinone/menaquinone biosynthesis C-methylase UbiE